MNTVEYGIKVYRTNDTRNSLENRGAHQREKFLANRDESGDKRHEADFLEILKKIMRDRAGEVPMARQDSSSL